MKLIDLHPEWANGGGEGISHQGQPVPEYVAGIDLDCPKCGAGHRLFIPFKNAMPYITQGWDKSGIAFEDLTLSPSILYDPAKGGCGAHFFIKNGEIQMA